jgi:hypothetical protein
METTETVSRGSEKSLSPIQDQAADQEEPKVIKTFVPFKNESKIKEPPKLRVCATTSRKKHETPVDLLKKENIILSSNHVSNLNHNIEVSPSSNEIEDDTWFGV